MIDKVSKNLKTIDEAGMFDPIPLVWGLERSQTGYLIDGKKSYRALDVKVGKHPPPARRPSKRFERKTPAVICTRERSTAAMC